MQARAASSPSRLASVQYIIHGLAVQPPNHKFIAAKIHQSLYNSDLLRTKKQQFATVQFNDGSVLHVGENTDIVLRNPHETKITKGTADQVVVPGTKHKVQTHAAVAAAVGTEFLVKITKHGAIFAVKEGALTVTNKKGTIVVTTGQETKVHTGKAPGPIVPISLSFGWSNAMPPFGGSMGRNVALTANGAQLVTSSPDVRSPDGTDAWHVQNLFDGNLSTGWLAWKTTNQSVTVELAGGLVYQIAGVAIDCASPPGTDIADSLHNFTVGFSTKGTADSDFTTAYKGTCGTKNAMQRFTFSHPTKGKYMQLVGLDNHGGKDGIGLRELEVVTIPEIGTPAESNCGVISCIEEKLALDNEVRAQYHLPPLTLDLTQSLGTGVCAGSYGHSVAMAETGSVWHAHAGYAWQSYPNNICVPHKLSHENIGEYQDISTLAALKDIQASYMANPHDPQTCRTTVNHACNLIDPRVTSIGIGIYKTGDKTWVTEDLIIP